MHSSKVKLISKTFVKWLHNGFECFSDFGLLKLVHSDNACVCVCLLICLFIKVTNSDWSLPARYMKMEHQMMASTILRMIGRQGKTFSLDIYIQITFAKQALGHIY